MKIKHETKNRDEAVNLFLQTLPDPIINNSVSTVEDQFIINGKKVKLSAQKTISQKGMTWKIQDVK